jgi:hypothetical protein
MLAEPGPYLKSTPFIVVLLEAIYAGGLQD